MKIVYLGLKYFTSIQNSSITKFSNLGCVTNLPNTSKIANESQFPCHCLQVDLSLFCWVPVFDLKLICLLLIYFVVLQANCNQGNQTEKVLCWLTLDFLDIFVKLNFLFFSMKIIWGFSKEINLFYSVNLIKFPGSQNP